MERFCKFIKDVRDDKEIIFHKNMKYVITYETKDTYYFSKHKLIDENNKEYTTGIAKSYINQLYKVITIS